MTSSSTPGDSLEAAEVMSGESHDKPSFFGRIGRLLGRPTHCPLVEPSVEPLTLDGGVRIAWREHPFVLELGRVQVVMQPDLPISGEIKDGSLEWIIHPGEAFFTGVPRFLRIKPGQTIVLGRGDDVQSETFEFDKSVAERHVKISNNKGQLTLIPFDADRPTKVTDQPEGQSTWQNRLENLKRLPEVLGRPLALYDDEEALDVIVRVNKLIAKEAYREKDEDGQPGGIIQFPRKKTVIVLGDVHTQINNVLRILTEGGTLSALENDEACLVFLGDLVHSEDSLEVDDMITSMFSLDMYCMLKLRFPENVFYVHGNHESFAPDVGKSGVPQGILMRRFLKKRRGKAYVHEIEKLFDHLAYIVCGNDYAACHGGPVRSRANHAQLVNIARYPGLQHELVWNRFRKDSRPAGYGKGSVKRFRHTLDIPKHAPVVVGHTPLSLDETIWFDVGGITGHHIVYTAHEDRAATVVFQDKHTMLPLEFIPEGALDVLNPPAEES